MYYKIVVNLRTEIDVTYLLLSAKTPKSIKNLPEVL